MTSAHDRWQREATDRFYASGRVDFTVSATPGAGKTRFSLQLFRQLLEEGTAQRLAVIVPTDALRQQWADQAAHAGLSLIPVSESGDYDKRGYDGCVATYAQLTIGAGSDLLRRSTRTPTVAVLDEIHHAGRSRSWGDGVTHALEHAVHRIALTGTPWRRNTSEPIPFVSYDDSGKVVVDYAYGYGAAVADGVCRGIVFDAYEGEGRWRDCGVIEEAKLGADLDDEHVGALLETMYQPDNEWVPSLFRDAVARLDEVRAEVPDAGGLVLAERQYLAHAYGQILADLTGRKPEVITSEDPEAKHKIDRFRDGSEPWAVAVRMVSEGVDIPRLAVGVYASKIRSPLFFRQVVGRFVRTRPDESLTAHLFIPAVPVLMRHAREIDEELRHQLDVEADRDEKARAEARSQQRTLELREPLSATEAVFDRSIFSGDDVTPEERARAVEECRRQGIPQQYAAQIARMLRGVQPTHDVTISLKPSVEPRHRRERLLRTEVEKLARKFAYRTGMPFREVNTELLRMGFPKRRDATLVQLEAMSDWLAEQLGEL